ncbi:Hypothetical predicted protein, partial [Marmota monax]
EGKIHQDEEEEEKEEEGEEEKLKEKKEEKLEEEKDEEEEEKKDEEEEELEEEEEEKVEKEEEEDTRGDLKLIIWEPHNLQLPLPCSRNLPVSPASQDAIQGEQGLKPTSATFMYKWHPEEGRGSGGLHHHCPFILPTCRPYLECRPPPPTH